MTATPFVQLTARDPSGLTDSPVQGLSTAFAPVIRSPGRMFEVKTVHLSAPAGRRDERLELRMAAVIGRALTLSGQAARVLD